jgi:hypothetical protein
MLSVMITNTNNIRDKGSSFSGPSVPNGALIDRSASLSAIIKSKNTKNTLLCFLYLLNEVLYCLNVVTNTPLSWGTKTIILYCRLLEKVRSSFTFFSERWIQTL